MFKLIYTDELKPENNQNIIFNYDTVEEAQEHGDREMKPCAIVSEEEVLVKLLIDGEWITFH